ncbi:MAG: hypothetical protein QM628_15640 [Propionicimonas sp.]
MTEPQRPLGDALAALGRDLDLSDTDLDAINAVRDRTPAEPLEVRRQKAAGRKGAMIDGIAALTHLPDELGASSQPDTDSRR